MRLDEYRKGGKTYWRIEIRDADGKRRFPSIKSLTGHKPKNRKEAKAWFETLRREADNGTALDSRKLSLPLADCLSQEIDRRKVDGIGSQWEKFLRLFSRNLCRLLGGSNSVNGLTEIKLASYRDARKAEGRSCETRVKELGFIKASVVHALEDGKIGKLPWHPSRFPKVDRSEEGPTWYEFSNDQIVRLLGVLDTGYRIEGTAASGRGWGRQVQFDPWLRRLCIFVLNTGARKSEARRLVWADVAEDHIRIKNMKVARAKKTTAKTRRITMTAELASMFADLPRGKDNETVFPTIHNVDVKWKRALLHSNIPRRARIHDLRHALASRLSAANVSAFTIATILGHSSTRMSQRYVHTPDSAVAEAMRELDYRGEKETAEIVAVAAAE